MWYHYAMEEKNGKNKVTVIQKQKAGVPFSPEKFVNLTAREMQVPITTLAWNIERLVTVGGEALKAPEAQKLLRRIFEANNRLVTLVEDLQNLARLYEGAFVVSRRTMQITEIARKAVRTVEKEATERGLAISVSANTAGIPLTQGDPERVYQVILNLLSNAVKYTPRGGKIAVSIRLTNEAQPVGEGAEIERMHPLSDAKQFIALSVQDTGMGIPEDEKENIFRQFFRGRKAVATETGGTGLGLFLVRTIVEQHGGSVWFVSREGVGTTFSFTVPVIDPYGQEKKDPAA